MLVMSLSLCWAHVIRRSSETIEIVVFPRRGSHFRGSTRLTRRGIPGASMGVARALMGHAFGTFLRLPATLVALCACYSGNFRSNLDKFPIFFLFDGSLERSRAAFLSISSKFKRIFGTFLAKLPENWKHGRTAEYIGPAILF